jgi:hypothetical protein
MNLHFTVPSQESSTRNIRRDSCHKMAMAIDSQQQRQFGGGLPFDHMPYSNSTNFTNPWAPSSAAPSQQLYASSTGLNPNPGLDTLAKQQASRINNNNVPMSSYAGVPTTSAGSSLLGDAYGQEEILTLSRDLLNPPRMQNGNAGYGNDVSYTSAPASTRSSYATSLPYDAMGYTSAHMRPTYSLQQHQQTASSRLSQL